jgi:hypothetical protein
MPEGGRYPHAGVSMAEHRMTPIFDRAVSNDKIYSAIAKSSFRFVQERRGRMPALICV